MYPLIKRILDIVFSTILIVILMPVMILIAIAIKMESPGPVLFKQNRVGIRRSIFTMLKFRTMKLDTPHDIPTHRLNEPDKYITRSGRVLRNTSLDELPQLFNILTGKMSFVGPRPALWNQNDLISEREKYKANDIRPGLTGWAQVNGRDELSISEKAERDGEYKSNYGISMDIKCFMLTLAKVVTRDGVKEGG